MVSKTTLAETLLSPIDLSAEVRLATAGANWRSPLSAFARIRLTENTTFYVRTDGNDANSGLANTAAGAWRTLQHAVDTIVDDYDGSGFNVTIQMGAGEFDGAFLMSPLTGVGALRIKGAGPGRTQTTILRNTDTSRGASDRCCFYTYAPSAPRIQFSFLTVKVTDPDSYSFFETYSAAYLSFYEVKVHSTHASSQISSFAVWDASVQYQLGYDIFDNLAAGTIEFEGVLGTGLEAAASACVLTVINGTTLLMTGTPSFFFSFAWASTFGFLNSPGSTIVGAATGKRFDVRQGGYINVGGNGLNYFPGSVAGTVESNGCYNGNTSTTVSTVAALPAASSVPMGTRRFVTDANATTFNSIVAGGGANKVPVFSDQTNWRIG